MIFVRIFVTFFEASVVIRLISGHVICGFTERYSVRSRIAFRRSNSAHHRGDDGRFLITNPYLASASD